jgi:hypothetical protein
MDADQTQSLLIDHDESFEQSPAKRLSLSIKEFVDDFRTKIPSDVSRLDIFAFTDKTDIRTTDTYTRFTFVPARINLLDVRSRSIGFVSVDKLLALYGPSFKLTMYESEWMKLDQRAKINDIHVNLKSKTSKTGHEYYTMYILAVPTSNIKAIEKLTEYYAQTPSCKYQRPTEFTDDNAFGDDQSEYDCGM